MILWGEHSLWTLVRAVVRAALFLWFLWPLTKGRRQPWRIALALLLVVLGESVRLLSFLEGGGLLKAVPRQILLILGTYAAALVLSKIQRLYAFYLASVFSFALGLWKNLVSPYFFPGVRFPAEMVQSSLAFTEPVRTVFELSLCFLTLLLLKKTFFTMEPEREMRGSQAFLALFPLFSNWLIFVALYDSFFFEEMLKDYALGQTLALVYCTIIAASLIIVVIAERSFKNASRRARMEQEQRLLEEAYSRMEERRRADESLRTLRHDMKNHLTTLAQLAKEGRAEGYLDDLLKNITAAARQLQTGDPTLDVVLEQKQQQCSERGIELRAYPNLSGVGFLAPMEICTLFANCIDNGIEAVEKLPKEQRWIVVSCAPVGGGIVAKFTNPCPQKPNIRENSVETTKKDKSWHGYGLKSVEGVAVRHGGALWLHWENGLFCTTWMIPVPPKN